MLPYWWSTAPPRRVNLGGAAARRGPRYRLGEPSWGSAQAGSSQGPDHHMIRPGDAAGTASVEARLIAVSAGFATGCSVRRLMTQDHD
jgi:hypothetical protein